MWIAIWWPKYVNTLYSTGVWNAIVQRIAASGFKDSVSQCDAVLQELRELLGDPPGDPSL